MDGKATLPTRIENEISYLLIVLQSGKSQGGEMGEYYSAPRFEPLGFPAIATSSASESAPPSGPNK